MSVYSLNYELCTCHWLPCGVDPRSNQGDCKISQANLRNSPEGSGNLARQSSLGEVSLHRKSHWYPLKTCEFPQVKQCWDFPLPLGKESDQSPWIPPHFSLVGLEVNPTGKPMTCALVSLFFCLSSLALCVALQEEVDDNPPFCIMEGSTFFRRNKEWQLFGDFSLKILGEITEGGFWVCAFGTRVLGRHVERWGWHAELSTLGW